MTRRIVARFLLVMSAFVAVLAGTPAEASTPLRADRRMPIHTYVDHHNSATSTYAEAGRGPLATSYDYIEFASTVDSASRGALACLRATSAGLTATYTASAKVARAAVATVTTLEGVEAASGYLRLRSLAGVAAETADDVARLADDAVLVRGGTSDVPPGTSTKITIA